MCQSLGLKFWGTLGLGAALTLAGCGGGGGDSGSPLNPPTAKLIMTPNISGLTMTVGESDTSLKISGGQAPYYELSSGTVIPALMNDGSLFLLAVAPTQFKQSGGDSSGTGGSGGSGGSGSSTPMSCATDFDSVTDAVWVQDSSYAQTQVKFTVCVNPGGNLVSPLYQSMGEGAVAPRTFTIAYGTPPYQINVPTSVGVPAVDTSKLISLPATSAAKSFQVSLVAKCLKADRNIPIRITDYYGSVAEAMIGVVNSNLSNDSNSGCL